MDPLPFIDEHCHRVDASPDAVWAALSQVLRGQMGASTSLLARLLGCDPDRGTPAFTGRQGEALPGFRVVESQPGRCRRHMSPDPPARTTPRR